MHDHPASSIPQSDAPVIALVAGESSGDQLGAALIRELTRLYPGASFVGIGGPEMKTRGMDCWWPAEELAVMGLFEVLFELPRLLRLRKNLKKRLLALKPDVYIGIDAPDFNLGLEKQLRKAGIKTVHYVSPSIWAWRQGRAKKIGESADLVLCLFPFEPSLYEEFGVRAEYTGHPMADEIDGTRGTREARLALGLDPDRPCIGILPGSRGSEVDRLSHHLLGAAQLLSEQYPGMQFAAPMASDRIKTVFDLALAKQPALECLVTDRQARTVMEASDLVLCASGTATLETLLVNRPMVIVYRISHLSYALVRSLNLVKSDHFSLPNTLASKGIVPELAQYEVTAGRIAAEAISWLNNPDRAEEASNKFSEIHEQLQMDAAQEAARSIRKFLEKQ